MEYLRRDYCLLVFGTLVLAILGSAFVALLIVKGVGRTYPVYVAFSRFDASIKPGSPVFVAGFPIGRVKSVQVIAKPRIHFNLELRINKNVLLPEGTCARISKGIGISQLILVPPAEATAYLKPGSVIPAKPPINLSEAFKELGPKLKTLLASIEEMIPEINKESVVPITDRIKTVSMRAGRLKASVGRVRAETEKPLLNISGSLDNTMKSVDGALSSLDLTTRQIQDWIASEDGLAGTAASMGNFLESINPSLDELSAQADATIGQLDRLLAGLDQNAGEKRVDRILNDIRDTLVTLRNLERDVREKPWLTISKKANYTPPAYAAETLPESGD